MKYFPDMFSLKDSEFFVFSVAHLFPSTITISSAVRP